MVGFYKRLLFIFVSISFLAGHPSFPCLDWPFFFPKFYILSMQGPLRLPFLPTKFFYFFLSILFSLLLPKPLSRSLRIMTHRLMRANSIFIFL
ncbi:hypothetical protein ASPWEDRAFT_246748 [Aspergillus wentii DTO 134E9]|uniref:Uncharacterized protein n=1 Tax=Aspergillus wentii DTO 134E9 TaxID=1073089 RepID=A0A1L9S1V9_ASPWE|nr:uncharacterized protein ASPWEDRAFT_246748 [Aspergillus wentii DTO 134E9]OJJ41126.1 hypothetical protein ASPWEDRAFT_246748 [Aspergillus wentii DTO 134E9]